MLKVGIILTSILHAAVMWYIICETISRPLTVRNAWSSKKACVLLYDTDAQPYPKK
jgi:hypothetical protein